MDAEGPTGGEGALAHADPPDASLAALLHRRKSDAIVHYGQAQALILYRQLDHDVAGFGVTDDVGQRLLQDPKHGDCQVRIKGRQLIGSTQLTGDVVALFGLLEQPLYRREQAQIIDHAGAQLVYDRVAYARGALEQGLDLLEVGADRARRLFAAPLGQRDGVAERDQLLSELIVKALGDAAPLLLPPRLDGSRLNVRYRMKRNLSSRSRLGAFELDFQITAHGLGYSAVEVDIKPYGIRSRQFLFSTPTEPGWMDLRIGQSVRNFQLYKGRLQLERRIGAALADTLSRLFLSMYKHDVAQDFELWRHKCYVAQPLLAKGDGPVGLYRKWTRQFYQVLPVLQPAASCHELPE